MSHGKVVSSVTIVTKLFISVVGASGRGRSFTAVKANRGQLQKHITKGLRGGEDRIYSVVNGKQPSSRDGVTQRTHFRKTSVRGTKAKENRDQGAERSLVARRPGTSVKRAMKRNQAKDVSCTQKKLALY